MKGLKGRGGLPRSCEISKRDWGNTDTISCAFCSAQNSAAITRKQFKNDDNRLVVSCFFSYSPILTAVNT